MTEEQIKQKAQENAGSVSNFDLNITLMVAENKIDAYRLGRNDGFIDGYHECEKEHEWHYVKDGNPDNENDILCQISKDEVEVGYYHTKEKRYYTIDGKPIDVIRWQKIVFPKESE